MKILVVAISAKVGGAKTLINSFIESIDNSNKNEFYFMINRGSIKEDIREKSKENIFFIENDIGNLNYVLRFFWYQFVLPKYIRDNKIDYMINLTNYGPISPGCKQILLLHNAKHISSKIKKDYGLKGKALLYIEDFIFKLTLLGVQKVVVQTNYMKQGVIRNFNVNEDNIEIIPSSPGRLISNIIDEKLENNLVLFIDKEENVLSYIGMYYKYKNLENLLLAAKYIRENCNIKLKLILTVDEKQSKEAYDFLKLIKKYRIEDYVMTVGNIDHDNVHQILRRSKALVFPSYEESFGIPFVEAMRFGLPIIAADLGFAHDVCGQAASYFKFDDYSDLANKIIDVLTKKELYLSLRNESVKRNNLYDEHEIVNQYLKLLRK